MAIITISRGCFSGGSRLASQLGQRLGAKIIGRDVVSEAAQRYGASEDDLMTGLSTPPGLWDRWTHHKERYILAVQAALADMVKDGNAIYHGLGGQFLLMDLSGVIHLRLIAPMERRVRRAATECKLAADQAVRHIEEADEQRTRWVKLLYGAEWSDPGLYDLVLNLEHVSIETACEIAVDLVGRKEYRRTEKIVQERSDFALATRIRADLAFQSDFPDSGLDVAVRRGQLRLSGAYFDRHREEVLAFIRTIPGAEAALADFTEDEASLPLRARKEQIASDFMLPIDAYPSICENSPIREAMVPLTAFTLKMSNGHTHRPRYVLVRNERDEIVGVVGRRSLLRGLAPQLLDMEQTMHKAEAMGVIADYSFPMSFSWVSMFGRAAHKAADAPVGTVMAPLCCSVRPEDDVSVVVGTMLQHGVDLVPVITQKRPVGVILMTHLFETVAAHVLDTRSRPS